MLEGLILLTVAVGAMVAFVLGVALLIMWFRSEPADDYEAIEPQMYGNLVQCPACGRTNPLDSATCRNCGTPLNVPAGYHAPAPPARPQPPSAYGPPPTAAPPPGSTVRSAFAPPPESFEGTRRASATPPAAAPQPVAKLRSAEPVAANGGPEKLPDAWLEGLTGALEGQRMILVQADTLFGRSTGCDKQVPDPKVSRKHFAIRFAQGGFFLQDQGSSRGTFINGKPVKAQRLEDGDLIELGDTTMVFHLE